MRWRARAAALLASAALAAAPLLAATPAVAEDSPEVKIQVRVPERGTSDFTVSNAQLRWGINSESGAGAFFGGCNFMSAGAVGDTGGGRVWTAADGFFSTRSGNVTIEKPYAVGGSAVYRPVPFADRCKSIDGTEVTTGNHKLTGITAVVENGTGSVYPAAQSAEITWKGSFTVVTYGGLAYWWVSDPVLKVTNGRGTLTATASGFGTSREDMTKWAEIPEQTVTLANLTGIDLTGTLGFATVPEYRGVRVEVPADTPQVRTGPDWGAFPQSTVDFHQLTGLGSYFYSSGGVRDPLKVATTVWVSYDADAALPPTPPPNPAPDPDPPTGPTPSLPGGGGGGGSGGSGTGTGGGQGGTLPAPAAAAVVAGPALAAAIAATTVFPLVDSFIPTAVAAASRPAVAWSVAGLLAVASGMVLGFRRGWLRWPGQ